MRLSLKTLLTLAATAWLAFPCAAPGAVLTADTLWQGQVTLSDDVLVPAGVTLTIAPGTVITVGSAESSKTDPEYLSPLLELTVRGRLKAEATAQAPIVFASAPAKPGTWAGILIDGGSASLRACRIHSAESALQVMHGSLDLTGSTLSGNRYGLVLQGKTATLRGADNRVSENDYGLVLSQGAAPAAGSVQVSGNRKRDSLTLAPKGNRPQPEPAPHPEPQPLTRGYGDEVLSGETLWRGRIEINGVVRVPQGSRLVILPGTVVEFGLRDTNGDGIGESGVLVQGSIIAKGTPSAPIVLRAAGQGRRGAWDAINIMNSAGSWNLIEHCRIQDAYRGLHFHFSRVAVTNSSFTNNYRGIQFQEATVLLRGNRFFDNKSAVQGRDAEVSFTGNWVQDNFMGVNFLRTKLTARGNRIMANVREGIRIREGSTLFEENLVDGNRYGLLVMDAVFGSFLRNAFSNNSEIGFSLKNTDNMEISGNFIAGNGLNGINLQETRGEISGNLISDNGERGLAVLSFAGTLEQNNLSGNGLYALDLDGSADVLARHNWWGGEPPERVVFDSRRDRHKGTVDHGEPAGRPFPFAWPLAAIETDLTWRDEIVVQAPVQVAPGATLTVAARSRVLFAERAGLEVKGRIVAQGEPGGRILFSSSARKEAGAWGEILLEHADGSSFADCIIEYATWGIHSHFTRLSVRDSLFRHNRGGLRFRSGPVQVSGSEFSGNEVGIRSFRGNASIEHNRITGNVVGIFVREKGGGLSIRRNELFANSDYNLRVGDFNDEDVDARENWWGSLLPQETLYDGRREPGVGMVHFEPYLREPGSYPRGAK